MSESFCWRIKRHNHTHHGQHYRAAGRSYLNDRIHSVPSLGHGTLGAATFECAGKEKPPRFMVRARWPDAPVGASLWLVVVPRVAAISYGAVVRREEFQVTPINFRRIRIHR
jgi:hypothetical protein